MNLSSCYKYPCPCIALLHCSLIASLFLPIIAGCGEGDSKVVEVVQITPEPGKRISYREQFTVQFNTPIIPSSGSITFGNWTFTLPDSAVSDTITWTRCYSGFIGQQVPFIIRDFQDVDGRIQAKAFQASYSDFYIDPLTIDVNRRIQAKVFQASYSASKLDIDPPTILAHHPSGSSVDPAITRDIRIVFNYPIALREFKIDPPIDGTAHVGTDDLQCIGVVRWDFADTDQLRYATHYHIELEVNDAHGQWAAPGFDFSTRAKP